MLDTIVQFSLNRRAIILATAAVLSVLGVWAWITLNVEAYPDIADTEVSIVTQYEGRPAEEIEQQITIPIERAVNSVPKVISRRSQTIYGLSIVRLTFEEGTDDYFARQQTIDRLKNAELPEGVEPELGPLTTPVGEIFRYVVESDGRHSPMDLRELQDWVIIPKVRQAPGVEDIANFGGLARRHAVIVNPQLLEKYKLTIQNVSDAIVNNNGSTGGNFIVSGISQIPIRSIGRIRKKEDIERIVVASQHGVPVFVRDVASVETGAVPPTGVLGYTDTERKFENENGVEGIVQMRRGENPSRVLANVREKIHELNTGLLPAGVKITPIYDRTELIDTTFRTVGRTLIEGISVVLLVLVFFLGSVRAALAVAVTIPLSLLFAFITMKLTGIPANLLSLGAIDFGIIVDASVVMVESIMRHISGAPEEERGRGLMRLIFLSSREVQRQIVYSISIIVLAYLPLFTLQRVEGRLFSPMAYTLSAAVAASLLFALTIMPVVCSFLFARRMTEWKNPVMTCLLKKYADILPKLLRYPGKVIGAAGAIVLVSLIAGFSLGTEYLPELDEGWFDIRCVLPAGVSLEEAKNYPKRIRDEVTKSREVGAVYTQLGRDDAGTEPFGQNRIEIFVRLKPYNGWTSGNTKSGLLKEMKRRLERAVPAAKFSFSQPIIDMVMDAATGSSAHLAVIIGGDDLKVLTKAAKDVLAVVKDIRGASEFCIEQEGGQSQLVIEVDRESAARYGINIRDIDTVIELAVAGKPISLVYEGDRRFDIALRYSREERSSPDAIGKILITSGSGAKIPLSQVAAIKMTEGATIISRENGLRRMSVRTNIRDRDQGGFVREAQKAVSTKVTLPEQYTVNWGGQFENLSRARNRLMVVVPVTIFLIFAVLYMLFSSGKYAWIVMANVPFALVGGIMALLVRGINFNVSAGVGFVSLFGISVMSGVLLVSYVNSLRAERNLPLFEAVVEGALTQFRPRVTVMILALIGLIPAARATGIGSDIQRPLATVIVGGLLSSLVLTLLVLPVIYYLLEDKFPSRSHGRHPSDMKTLTAGVNSPAEEATPSGTPNAANAGKARSRRKK